MLSKQSTGALLLEQVRRLVDRATVTAIAQRVSRPGVRRVLSNGLGETQPPRRVTGVIVVVKQRKDILAGKRQKSVAVEDLGLRLEEGVGAETMLVDFEDKSSAAAEGL